MFFKYVNDRWTEHHGRYPSTGMLAIIFALHVCDQVGRKGAEPVVLHDSSPRRVGFQYVMASLLVCAQVSVFGYGADQQGNWHHYWEENRHAGAFKKTGVHSAEFETKIIHRLAKEGKISLHL